MIKILLFLYDKQYFAKKLKCIINTINIIYPRFMCLICLYFFISDQHLNFGGLQVAQIYTKKEDGLM